MATTDHYDTISIGSGEAGKYVCWTRSSTLGVRTAVIEHKWLGGSCPNIACLPSKNFIYSAEVVHTTQKYAATGLLKAKDISVDMNAVLQRKRDMVKGLVDMHKGVFEKSGAELILGHGRFLDKHSVEIELKDGGKRVITADNIIICTGSRARIDDTPGLKDANPLTHIEILELDVVPEHLVILGGGYIGLEFAQTFRRFGSKVSVLDRNARILSKEDDDVSEALVDILKSEGVDFYTSTDVSAVSGTSGTSVTLTGTHAGTPFSLKGTHLLAATGRLPNTSDTNLSAAGVTLTPTGHIAVNAHLQTSTPHIFAVGDVANSPHFTHIGFDDFRIVRDFLAAKKHTDADSPPTRSTTARQVPYTLYTSPELAHVGLSERAAKRADIPYRLAKLPMAAFLRTRTMDASSVGFAKALISKDDDTILGFTALGPRAGELLPAVQVVMAAGLGYGVLRDLVVVHPTVGEGLVALFGGVPSRG